MRKKGFTLIELLAVIVILAIIALIAVPIVVNIINDAKEESIKRSINQYLNTVTNTITKENIKHKYNPDECVIQEDGNLICSEKGNELTTSDVTKILKIDMKGKKQNNGTIKLQNGKIIDIEDIYLEGKYANYDEKKNILFFSVPLPTEAGLYDKNRKLLATWDQLVDYGLDISAARNYSTDRESTSMLSILNKNNNLSLGKILVISSSVTIGSGVKSIGDYAFMQCTSLTSITFENTTGWFITSSSTATSGTSMYVTNASTNATNLKSTYYDKWWKRS